MEATLARHHALGGQGLVAQRQALYQSERDTTLARHRALGALAAHPAARTYPAAPGSGLGVLATLLVGLVATTDIRKLAVGPIGRWQITVGEDGRCDRDHYRQKEAVIASEAKQSSRIAASPRRGSSQ